MVAVAWSPIRSLLFWGLVCAVATLFLAEAAVEIAGRKPADVVPWRLPWLTVHAVLAVPLLVIAPLQFSSSLRKRRPSLHRWVGRIFLSFSLVAAGSAFILGISIGNPGARVPLALFSSLWVAFVAIAWLAARARDIDVHRRFVIRSIAIGFAFVWVRVLQVLIDPHLGFMEDAEMRSATREWLGFVMPLIIVEAWLTWWPSVRRLRARRSRS